MAEPLSSGGASAATAAEPADRPDRRVLLVLLGASGITLAFLVAAMYRENFHNE